MSVSIEIKTADKVLENRAFEVVPRKGELIRNAKGEYARVIEVVHRHVAGGPAQVGVIIEPLG